MNIQRNQLGFKGNVELKLPGELSDKGERRAIVNTDNLLLKGQVGSYGSLEKPGTKLISNGETLAFFNDKSPADVAEILGMKKTTKTIDLTA